MPFSLNNPNTIHLLFNSPPPLTPLQRARRAAAAPAARAAHVARKHLCCEPCATADDAGCAAASTAPAAVYVALRVHDTKLTLLRLRAPPPRPPPAPVAASPPPASAGPRTPPRRNTPRPLGRLARAPSLLATRFDYI